jgi:hypothetical protein
MRRQLARTLDKFSRKKAQDAQRRGDTKKELNILEVCFIAVLGGFARDALLFDLRINLRLLSIFAAKYLFRFGCARGPRYDNIQQESRNREESHGYNGRRYFA